MPVLTTTSTVPHNSPCHMQWHSYAGVDVVSNKGKLQWPAKNLGSICGDEPGQKKWDTPGQVSGTYKAGGEITTDILFAQNHLGRVFMSVCPLNAKSESECKPLQR